MTKNKGWEKTKTLSWEEKRVGDANDKARDHFTVGEIEFIRQLLAQELRGLLDEIEKEVNGIRLSSINTEYLAGQKIAFAKVTNILTKIKKRLEEK